MRYNYVYYNIGNDQVIKNFTFDKPYLVDGKPAPIPPAFKLLEAEEIRLPIDINNQRYDTFTGLDLENNKYKYIYSGIDTTLTEDQLLQLKLNNQIEYRQMSMVYYNVTTGNLTDDIELIIHNFNDEEKQFMSGVMYDEVYTFLPRYHYGVVSMFDYMGYDSEFLDNLYIRYYDSGVQ